MKKDESRETITENNSIHSRCPPPGPSRVAVAARVSPVAAAARVGPVPFHPAPATLCNQREGMEGVR